MTIRISAVRRAMILAVALLLGALAPRAGAQDLNLNLCNNFNAIVNNPLLGDLDPEFSSFISLLDPNQADINGQFAIDDSGDSLVVQLQGNLMKDVVVELRALERIANNPDLFPEDGPTVYSNADVVAAWNANTAQIEADVGPDLAPLLPLVLGGFKEVLIAYVTLGGGSANITSEDPIVVDGTGSFGFVQALFGLLNPILMEELNGAAFANPNISADDYVQLTEFGPDGDLDGDGFSNLCESFYFRRPGCGKGGSDPTIGYPGAATDPTIVPDGCFIQQDICEVPLTQGDVVDGAGNDSVGQLAIRYFVNDTTAEELYRLDAVFSTTFATSVEFRRGAPGETGETLFTLDPTLPIEAILTDEQLSLIRSGPTYVVVLRQEGENPEEVGVRGNIQGCLFLEGELEYHSADLNNNYVIEESELQSVVAFLDPPNNGAYQCDGDGYAPGSGDTNCEAHDSDFIAEDFRISVPEFLRLVQIYNADGYAPCEEGPDGWCPFNN
jgi:hypothetical protein